MNKGFLSKHACFLIITGVYLLLLFVVLPQFSFPLNDGWVYAKMTKVFTEESEIRFINWGEPTLIFHIWWGALFSHLLGFSQFALNFSVFLLSYVASISFYLILRHFKIKDSYALLGVLLILANPIFFFNSFTFMTEVSSLALTLLAILFYLKYDSSHKIIFLICASVGSVAVFLIRQNGIFLPLTFFIYAVFKKDNRISFSPMVIFWLLVFPLCVDGAAMLWRYHQPNIYTRPFVFPNIVLMVQLTFYILEYIGLFCLPFMIAFFLKYKNWRILFSKIRPILVLLIFCCLGVCIIAVRKIMPYLGNQITVYGMFGLKEVLAGSRFVELRPLFWMLITIFSTISTAWIIALGIVYGKSWLSARGLNVFEKKKLHLSTRLFASPKAFIYIITLLQIVFPIIIGNSFDRYILALLPGLIVLVWDVAKQFSFSKGLVGIGICASFILTCMLTFTTLNWNSIRWEEADALLSEGIPAQKIDAGFEWNGWHYPNILGTDRQDPAKARKPWYLRKIFPAIDDEYVISFSQLEGYEVLKERSYTSWFLSGSHSMYVLRRIEANNP